MTEPPDTQRKPTGGPTSAHAAGVRTLQPQADEPTFHAGQVNAVALREWGQVLGLADVGVTAVNETTLSEEARAHQAVKRWLEQEHHASLEYMTQPRLTPLQLLPDAKTVIVGLAATERVSQATLTPKTTGYIAAYARGQDYHHALKDKLWRLAQRVCDALGTTLNARVCVDTAPVLERYWASRTGVAFVGKSTMAIAPGIGSRVLIGLLLLDRDLTQAAAPERLLDGCGSCTRCLDACPTQAFPEPYVLDARKCIAFLTIENAGEIPPELRPKVGTHVFGCDVCQTVCPYNASRKLPAALPELEAHPQRRVAELVQWLGMSSGDYRRLTRQSALRRAPRAQLQRNAAVALGNTDDPRIIPELARSLEQDQSPLVRKHVVWALGQLLPKAPHLVQPILHAGLERETHPDVRQEFERVLASLDSCSSAPAG